jgi:hypothetical protein
MFRSIKVGSIVFVVFAVALLSQVSVSNAQPFAVTAVLSNHGLGGSGTLTFLLPTFVQSFSAKNMSDCCVDVELQGHSAFVAAPSGSLKVPSYQSYFFDVYPWGNYVQNLGGVPIGQSLTVKANWAPCQRDLIYLVPDPTVCPSELYLSFSLFQ